VIEGITIKQAENYLIATVVELSEELKSELRKRFTAICRGEDNSLLNRGSYTYKRTVAEFIKRIEKKSDTTRTGMLGELIVHVLTGLFLSDHKTIVPYFNLEERSIRKGFDSVIYSPEMGIWVYEVKSSKNTSSRVNVDSKTKSLIKTAHEDLSAKLADQDETTRIWDNAMHGFQVACGHSDEKNILQNIILDYQDVARTEECSPNLHNVILSSVLISSSDDEIGEDCVTDKHEDYKNTYEKLLIFAVHKSLTIDLLEFFSQEVADEAS